MHDATRCYERDSTDGDQLARQKHSKQKTGREAALASFRATIFMVTSGSRLSALLTLSKAIVRKPLRRSGCVNSCNDL